MTINYIAYGLPIVSEIDLPGFVPLSDTNNPHKPLVVKIGKVPVKLKNEPTVKKPFSTFNETEYLLTMPDLARYYVHDGEEIIIEPECNLQNDILLYFYSNCLAAALYQRNLIPFHVSGVFIDAARVVLFAAPSRIGKSTTSLMLQQKGYAPFTDDTAILNIENGKCFAYASYPVMRLWENTLKHQHILNESEKQLIRSEVSIDKFAFSFHDRFVTEKVEVAGIVNMNIEGNDIKIKRLVLADAIEALSNNIYRKQWVNGMKKELVKFRHLTGVTKVLPSWNALRPKNKPTFSTFADAIESEILEPLKHDALILS
ncbi:hypothetical protein [Emticicia sp. TH156]|uniref:hypothetical protein n=1 Tax=Emticicia sp. TH156 TaxID=2067454 RepID=UPI000C75B74A|nr:hypothetical protein [Emticicia sp. TH156]PLK43454.1 hypothetical protein C0V77_16245 [Emticicia sp. TH156]